MSVCWVLYHLLETHRNQPKVADLNFLRQYELKGDSFLHRMVMGDEIWVHYWTLASKQASMQWKTKDEIALRKFKSLP